MLIFLQATCSISLPLSAFKKSPLAPSPKPHTPSSISSILPPVQQNADTVCALECLFSSSITRLIKVWLLPMPRRILNTSNKLNRHTLPNLLLIQRIAWNIDDWTLPLFNQKALSGKFRSGKHQPLHCISCRVELFDRALSFGYGA